LVIFVIFVNYIQNLKIKKNIKKIVMTKPKNTNQLTTFPLSIKNSKTYDNLNEKIILKRL